MVNADNCQSGTSSYFLSLLSILFISEKYAKFVGLEPGLTGKTFIVQVPVSNSNFYAKMSSQNHGISPVQDFNICNTYTDRKPFGQDWLINSQD